MGREKMKQEAVERMKMLGIIDDAIKQFEEDDTVMRSENPLGALYELSDEEKEIAREFEDKYSALVYLAVSCNTEIGRMISYLYVPNEEEEWKLDRADISDNSAITYTHNFDAPDCSEIGGIGIESRNGGIVRTD